MSLYNDLYRDTWNITGNGDWLRATDRDDWRCAMPSLWPDRGRGTLYKVCSDLVWVININLPLPDSYKQGFLEHPPLDALNRDSALEKGTQQHQGIERNL